MIIHKTIMILTALCGITAVSYGAPIKVFILSGQSNMVGFGKSGEIKSTDGIASEFTKIRYYTGNFENNQSPTRMFYTLKPGTYQYATPANTNIPINTFGPELGIAKILSSTYQNEQIVMIKVAWGGTSLASNWIQNSLGTYDWFKARIQEAMNNLIATYGSKGFTIAGIFWMQGETDADSGPSMATVYSDNLKYFVEYMIRPFLRQYGDTLSIRIAPFIFGQIHNGWGDGHTLLQEQYRAQYKISSCRCTDVSRTASRWNETPVDSFQTKVGFSGAHYNTAGQLLVGAAFGNAYLEFLKGNPNLGCRESQMDDNMFLQIIQ